MNPNDVSVTNTLYGLGRCIRKAGRPGEGQLFFWRELEITDAKLGSDDWSVANTFNTLGRDILE